MSKFKPWIGDDKVNSGETNPNVFSSDDFNSETQSNQRYNGFTNGTVISARYVNSALRQANLVISALMECTGNNSLDLTSSVSNVKTALQTYFSGLYVARATSDGSGNNIASTYATKTGTYSGMTVGNATNASSATNVTTNINGKAISDIFAADGTTVKNANVAYKATVDSNGDNIVNTYAKQTGTYLNLIAGTAGKIAYTTTAPSASPTSGTLIIYVGTSLPSTRYDRVLYLIKG